jgi:pilus assembly protein FimV
MNGPSKISLAVALALVGGNAFALGLGSIQVRSGLNQPLDAEIAVSTDAPGEAAGISVSMANAEDFDRVGLSRGRVSVPIDFVVATNSRGQAVIKLTTKDAVREPFLDFLIQVNWPKGKLLREYTVLLDPPVTAPAAHGAPATVTPAKESTAAPAQKLAVEKPAKPAKATTVKPPKTAATEPKQPPAPKPAPPPAPTPSATARAPAAGDYGPVAEGETLSEVARATRPDESTNVNKMMLALLKANPNAFYKDNINALKRGAILRIPSGDELKATGNAAAVAAAVHEQNDAWTSGAAVSKPTVVANAGAPKSTPPAKTEPKTPPKSNEHLALVPPRAGKEGSQATADHPGPSSGTGNGADSKAELTRTKEALASREQEASELKSRVKQLEDLNGKDQRLLSLKESEIADLQSKLKELQSKPATPVVAATTAATKPADTASTATKPAETGTKPADTGTKGETKLTAQDIWGNIAATEKAGTKPGTASTTTTPAPTPSSTTTTPASTTALSTTGTATPSSTTAPSTSTTTPPVATTTPSTTPSTTTPATSTMPSTTTSTGTTVVPVSTPATSAPTSLTTPAATTTPAPKPVTPTPAPKPVIPPPPALEDPWYMNKTVQIGGGVGLLLIGLLALMRFMRKPKPVLVPMGSGAELDEPMAPAGDEEHHLLDALAQTPGDAHLSLELLNLYYSQRDAAKFEAAAEAMYAHIADPTQPEWQQVRIMGEELCPHNPLFSGADMGLGHGRAEQTVFGHYDTGSHVQEEPFDLGGHDEHALKSTAAEENFDFDLTDHSAAAAAAPAHDLGFAHEPPPAPAPVARPVATPAPVPVPAAAKPAEDFFAGEDAIGTKLDLAKAYLDMGDPEGARSMLDEVMTEGNDAQKGEARKLLAEIR